MTKSPLSSKIDLLINIDHVATLRNARQEAFPDPVHAAIHAEAAGADGIVFHPREDRRHITDRDVHLLKEVVTTKLDFELSMNEEVVALCCQVQPHLATLVPEKREEITTEEGLDVVRYLAPLRDRTRQLLDAGIEEVAFFVDTDLHQIDACIEAGANCIELHTGPYATASSKEERIHVTRKMAEAARHAHQLGLGVHAGHGLDYRNFAYFKAHVPHLKEVSIGFAVVARAMWVGFETAVREMLQIVKGN